MFFGRSFHRFYRQQETSYARASFLVHQVPRTSLNVYAVFPRRRWVSEYTCRPMIANLLYRKSLGHSNHLLQCGRLWACDKMGWHRSGRGHFLCLLFWGMCMLSQNPPPVIIMDKYFLISQVSLHKTALKKRKYYVNMSFIENVMWMQAILINYSHKCSHLPTSHTQHDDSPPERAHSGPDCHSASPSFHWNHPHRSTKLNNTMWQWALLHSLWVRTKWFQVFQYLKYHTAVSSW